MLFGRRKPGYTTTVDAAADPEQVILDLQKAEMAAKKKPKAEVFDIDAASETARRLKETGSMFDGSAAKLGEDVIAAVQKETDALAAKQADPADTRAALTCRGTARSRRDGCTGRRRKNPAAGFSGRCAGGRGRPLRRPAHRHRAGAAQADPGTGAGGLHPLPLGGGAGHIPRPAGE